MSLSSFLLPRGRDGGRGIPQKGFLDLRGYVGATRVWMGIMREKSPYRLHNAAPLPRNTLNCRVLPAISVSPRHHLGVHALRLDALPQLAVNAVLFLCGNAAEPIKG